MTKLRKTADQERGFTMLQMVIVLGVAVVISALAIFGINSARGQIRLTNSARTLAGYLEKARIDSVRRHPASNGDMAGVSFLNNTSYRVRWDSNGDGTLDTLDVALESGVIIATDPLPPEMLFDWRGRLTTTDPLITKVSITLQYGTSAKQASVDVTRSGDVTIDSDVYLDDVPNVNVNISGLTGVDSGSTVNANYTPTPTPTPTPEATPSPTPTPTPEPHATPTPEPTPEPTPLPTPDPNGTPNPTPAPTPEPTPIPCSVTESTSPSPLSFRKNGGSGTVTFTVTGGGAVTYNFAPANLSVTQTGTNNFTISSVNNSRGNFTAIFNSPCGGTISIGVEVTN